MSEEVKQEEQSVDNNYLEAIKKLKESTVDKTEYEKLLEENKKLINTIVEQKPVETKEEEDTKPQVDINKLRRELYGNSELSNLEYIDKTLQLRDALLQAGEPDPFIPTGSKYSPTDEDSAAANRVAEGLKHCVDYAKEYGYDSEVFTNELQRITVDVPLPKRKY